KIRILKTRKKTKTNPKAKKRKKTRTNPKRKRKTKQTRNQSGRQHTTPRTMRRERTNTFTASRPRKPRPSRRRRLIRSTKWTRSTRCTHTIPSNPLSRRCARITSSSVRSPPRAGSRPRQEVIADDDLEAHVSWKKTAKKVGQSAPHFRTSLQRL